MTETLAAFIARRTKELDDEELPLRQRMEQIKAERDQLRRASLAAGARGRVRLRSHPRARRRCQDRNAATA